jgi:hypothetical protein
MKRLCLIVVISGVLNVPAFAQTAAQGDVPREAPVEQTPLPENQARQLQQRIVDFYLSDFRREVELSDDQFLALAPEIRRFMQMSFRVANQRRALRERQNQMLKQPVLSEAEVQRLTEQQAQLDAEAGTLETRLIRRLQAQLTDRQILLVRPFNMRFFNETLPRLVERARDRATLRGQRPERPEAVDRPPIPTRDQTRPRTIDRTR